MAGFVAQIDPRAAEAAQEALSGGDGIYPPLPAGKYPATLLEIVGVADFGGAGANSDKKVLRIKLKISDQSPTGRGRTYYERIPLFTRYAPSEKNPQGATARAFWDFFGKAMGTPVEQLVANQLPGMEIQGRPLLITLGAPQAPDNYNPLGFNEVDFYDALPDVTAALRAVPTNPVVVPWLDASGNLIGGAPAGPPAAQTPPQWAVPAAPLPPVPAAPSAPPVWNAPAAVAAIPEANLWGAPTATPVGAPGGGF